MGKVPAIRHGETVVTEAAAISAYLADAFPQAAWRLPLGDKSRGRLFPLAVLRRRAAGSRHHRPPRSASKCRPTASAPPDGAAMTTS